MQAICQWPFVNRQGTNPVFNQKPASDLGKAEGLSGVSRGLGPAAAPRLSLYCNERLFFLTPKARLKGRGVGFVVARQV